MKTFIITIVALLSIVGCKDKETVAQIEQDITRLTNTRSNMQAEVQDLNKQRSELYGEINLPTAIERAKSELSNLQTQIKELKQVKYDVSPKIYVIKFRLKQSHFLLDIGKHVKDAVNAIEFELPVDKSFYDTTQLNAEIVDSFRMGSLLMEGSFGSWHMTVIGKRIEVVE